MMTDYERDALLREITTEIDAYLDPGAEEGTAQECAKRVMKTVEKWAYLATSLAIGRLLDAHEAEDLASGKLRYCETCDESFAPETDDQTTCSADCLHRAHGI